MSSREVQSDLFLSSDAINDEFFIDIIERKLNMTRDKFKLRLVFIAPATGKNENYVSVVYRAKISYEVLETKERKFLSVIIKALIAPMENMKEFAVFEREILMYENVIESFEKLWIDATGKEAGFGPKCIKVASNPYEIIVLDDLKAENYEMLDRKVGANFEQAKLVLSKLAKFHAASAVKYEKDGKISDDLDRLNIMKNEKLNSAEQHQKSMITFGNVYKLFVEAIKTSGFPEIAKKVARWDFMKLMTSFMAVAEPMKCQFTILNHGDSWLNNILFKSDESGNAIEMKYIDYQLSFWGSPSFDLSYFFISSVRDDTKIEHFDDLIVHYHTELTAALKELKYEKHIPTLSELQIDLIEKGSSFCFNMMILMFIVKYDSKEELSLDFFTDPERFDIKQLEKAFNNNNYQKALGLWVPFLNKRGYLDALLPETPLTPFMLSLMEHMQKNAAKPAEHVEEAPARVECFEE